jgi:NADH-quinone oxidoreductase subunit L
MRLYAIRASLQAMLVNKVGDACMLIALVLYCSLISGEDMFLFVLSWEHLVWLSFVIVLGACSKSALGLFHYWLPYAMEGPTSVSALIHAATLVTAGLFLVIKIKFILLSGIICFIMLCLSFIGILMLALIAADQFDVKRLIAYSTLSQIAYMFATIGLGALNVSVVYILVHALFKSLMFMTSGAIIHGIYDQQDLRTTSALAKTMPIALILCFGACLCMLGVVGTVGMYSKELIVELFGNVFRMDGW